MHLELGSNPVTGDQISLNLKALTETHTHIIGRTGRGKTKFLELLCRQIIDAGYPLIVLDGVGALYNALLKYVVVEGYGDRRVVLVNPEDIEYVPGINYLELLNVEADEATWGRIVIEGLKKIFREDAEFKPWLELWGLASLIPLIRSGMTVLEISEFVSRARPHFRDAILALPENQEVARHWQDLFKERASDQDAKLSAIGTRGSTLEIGARQLRRMLGQSETTIDWQRLMNTDGLVLAKARPSPKLSEQDSGVLGTILMHQITQVASMREDKDELPPCFVVADEFQRFASNDFVNALSTLRNYGVHLILSHQFLGQLNKIEGLREAVNTNAENKIVFSVSRKDAEELAGEMFSGYLDFDIVRHEIMQTKFRPVETTREVQSYSESVGTVLSAMHGDNVMIGLDTSPMLLPAEILPIERHGTSSGSSRADARAQQEGLSVVPFYEQEEFQEVSSQRVQTVTESWEWFRGGLVRQFQRCATVKCGAQEPIPLYTAYVEDLDVTDEERERYLKHRLYLNYPRAVDVDVDISKRVAKFIEDNPLPHASVDGGQDNSPQSSVRAVTSKRKSPRKKFGRDPAKTRR